MTAPCVLTTINARAVVSERSQDNAVVYTYCKADMVEGECEEIAGLIIAHRSAGVQC